VSSRKKILIVDDESANLDFFDVMLSKLGFSVERAENGFTALEKVKWFFPDLILLDNIMPKMSGWELTRILKEDIKLREIPIIMLSGLADVKDKVEGFELGIDDYITKPFNFSEVLARIRAVLRNREFFAQIVVRETRLGMAEALNTDLKQGVAEFHRGMDELDRRIVALENGSLKGDALLSGLKDQSERVRKSVAELDVRIEKTTSEWADLKKGEIGIQALEKQIRMKAEQEE
jgi:CheY-like chemotaxis protein